MSFSPGNEGIESPDQKLSRVTMCLDTEFLNTQDGAKSENMKVYARVRPMLQKEEDEGYLECIAAIDEEVVRAVVPATSAKSKNSAQNCQDVYDFKYTGAFGPESGQFVFFEQTIMDIMQGFIEGQNCLIFNYGITNSGKTYTLQGDENNPGIIPLAMHLFFGAIEHQLMDGLSVKPEKFSDIVILKDSERVQELRLKEELLKISCQESFNKTAASGSPNSLEKSFAQILCDCFRDGFKYQTETTLPAEEMASAQSALYMREVSKKSADQQPGQCNIWVSFIEIYNEYIYDLLQPNINQRAKLSLAEDQNGDVYIKGAREIYVANSTEAIKLLNVGRRNLRIASTKLNYQSSRSHCIFTVKVARVYDDDNGTTGRVNRISFCDLAGSERAAKSQTSGMRLKEAGYINTSLMVLGRCLDQLRLNQTARDKKMIPFRESKLTRLFSNHFLGKGKAVMIANASPCEYTFDETLNVLRFSALAKDLTINDSYISMTSSSLQDLTNQWMVSKGRLSEAPEDQTIDMDSEMQERDEMIEKLLDLADSLKNNLESEKKEKLELETKIRQDVCNEYAEYSDQLLDSQKKNYEDQIQSIKELYQKRLEEMEAKYEKRIKDLKAEYEASSDESFENSMNKTNVDDNAGEILINFSPAANLPVKQEIETNVSMAANTSMDCFGTLNECNDVNNISDIQLLKENLKFVAKELEAAKEKLDKTTQSLKEVQTEEAIAKEKCDSLNCKLLEANQVLEEYQKELDQFKSTCVMNDNEIDSLLEEKRNLQDNILSLSDKLAFVTAEMERLQKDNELKEKSLTESEKKIADLEEKIEQLASELQDSVAALKEEKEKLIELETEYANYKNCSIATKDFEDLKQKFDVISEQLDKLTAENELLKKDKLEIEESYEKEKMQVIEEMDVLEQKCKELSSQLEECTQTLSKEKSDFESLQIEFENHRNNYTSAMEDLNNLKEKHADVFEELGLATTKIELLKKEKLLAETEHDQEKTNLRNEMTKLEEKCKELSMKSENLTEVTATEKSKFDALEAEYESYKNRVNALTRDQEESNEKFAMISKQLDLASTRIEELQKEKLQTEKLSEGNYELLEKLKDTEKSLKEASNDIEEYKSKIHAFETRIEELESTCASYKKDNSELEKKLKDLQEEFKLLSEELDTASDERCKKLNSELEGMIETLEQEKIKVTELESKCSAYEIENEKLLQNLKDSEEKSALLSEQMEKSEVKEQYDSLSLSLEEANNQIEVQKLKIDELESACSTYKTSNSELINEVKDLQEKLTVVSEELVIAKAGDDKAKELNEELENITQALQEEKSKINELVSKCSAYEAENAKLSQDIKDFEAQAMNSEETISRSDKIENLTLRLEEVTQQLEDRKSKIDQLEEEYSRLKSENTELLNNLNAEKQISAQLSEEHALALSEVNKLQKEINQALEAHSKALTDLKTKEAATQEKYEDLSLKIKETSDTIDVQKAKITELESENKKYVNKNMQLSENLKTLKEKNDTMSETYAPLLQILEKCELCATHKIKFLHSSSIKNLEQMTDMNRQIKEKESSIEELERALCDSQKQLKESEAKAKKQLNALKQQHSIEIEELMHLKKLVEDENRKLKVDITEVKEKETEAKMEKDEEKMKCVQNQPRSTSNTSKGRKKRSLSDISKEENDNSQNKENSDQDVIKIVKDAADKNVQSKRRRVLRQRQDPIVTDTDSNEESDEEYQPRKATTRKRGQVKEQKPVQKKPAAKEPKVPVIRTSRRKLQEDTENVSPVKKAMAFVGSKIRSAAQAVSNMPSPRITRGRKKLFNADAPSTPLDRKWKY
ncbi:kinesin-like protein KIF20A [Trichonephila inaurata madagascariensis]|uniref:Kinesin-like protein KIF20A n=1 Tax=Trichonephila inaurata madagascariensis TaxID=2747483 RepID=A0A8X6I3Y2_9ARAC|nr:kinesin-like protein KIF20A [Trichonephila inaurata madagascariensis]